LCINIFKFENAKGTRPGKAIKNNEQNLINMKAKYLIPLVLLGMWNCGQQDKKSTPDPIPIEVEKHANNLWK